MSLRFHFLNVGNGNCHIVEHFSGRISVIDINRRQYKYIREGNYNQKNYPKDLIKYIKDLIGRKPIFRFILTHPDMDHERCIKKLFNTFKVINIWDTENEKEIRNFFAKQDKEDWEYYKKIRKNKENPKTLFLYRFSESKCCWIEDGITILSPTEGLVKNANSNKDWNLLSYVLLIQDKDLKIVLSGDATDYSWEDILEDLRKNNKLDLIQDIDVLVAPHHWRKSNQNYEFLEIIKPKLTLIGYAQSEHLNYTVYNKYSKKTLTNNKAGNVVIQKVNDNWYVLITNKAFVEKNSEYKNKFGN